MLQLYVKLLACRDAALLSPGGPGGLGGGPMIDTVDTLHIFTDSALSLVTITSIVPFLNQFVHLKVLRGWQSLSDPISLQALAQTTCRIHGLNFIDCYQLPSHAIASFAGAIGSELHVLKCQVLDSDDLTLISEKCHFLEALDASSPARVNASTLKLLTLKGPVDHHAILGMIQSCPHLVHFAAIRTGIPSTSTVLKLIAHYPVIETIALPRLTVTVATVNGRRMAEIRQLYSEEDEQTAVELMAAITIPVRLYCGKFADETSAVAALNCLAARFGPALEVLELQLKGDFADNKCICELLSRCPNLLEYCVLPWNLSAVLASLTSLVACRKLRKVVLKDRVGVSQSNANWKQFIEAYRHEPANNIRDLTLPSMEITSTVLHGIVAAFPRLQSVNMMHANIDKVLLLTAILRRELKATRIALSSKTAVWISENLGFRMYHKLV